MMFNLGCQEKSLRKSLTPKIKRAIIQLNQGANMANRYKFNLKNPVGSVRTTSDTLFAKDIKDACFKLSDLIDHKICDKEYSYFCSQVESSVSASSPDYTLLNFHYNGKPVQAFIEVINDSILKG